MVVDDETPRPGAPVDLSIIIPAYDEEDSVRPLYAALMAVLPGLGRSFEILFVDDGSTDRTFERLAELAAADACVRVIKLRRNYGQTPAMVAGIDHAKGRILITMDADLQNDPVDIPRLVEQIEAGHDIVVGWRHDRQDKLLSRRLPSVLANRLIARVTGVDVKDNGCTLKAYRAALIKQIPLYSEMHRFIPAMTSIAGSRLVELKVKHHPRRFGTSKYGLSRTYKVCFDLIAIKTLLTFSRNPLFCFLGSAAITALIGLIGFLVAVYYAMAVADGSAVVFLGIAFLFGSLAIFLALIGVIGSLVYTHFRHQPGAAWAAPST
jgi:glycosyltransferase involved in cell wall biosynthesis